MSPEYLRVFAIHANSDGGTKPASELGQLSGLILLIKG